MNQEDDELGAILNGLLDARIAVNRIGNSGVRDMRKIAWWALKCTHIQRARQLND
jgi:hypothetical protein